MTNTKAVSGALSRQIRREDEVSGELVLVKRTGGAMYLFFADGRFAAYEGTSDEDSYSSVYFNHYDINLYALWELGLISKMQYEEEREAAEKASNEVGKEARRRQYEDLKLEFEGS